MLLRHHLHLTKKRRKLRRGDTEVQWKRKELALGASARRQNALNSTVLASKRVLSVTMDAFAAIAWTRQKRVDRTAFARKRLKRYWVGDPWHLTKGKETAMTLAAFARRPSKCAHCYLYALNFDCLPISQLTTLSIYYPCCCCCPIDVWKSIVFASVQESIAIKTNADARTVATVAMTQKTRKRLLPTTTSIQLKLSIKIRMKRSSHLQIWLNWNASTQSPHWWLKTLPCRFSMWLLLLKRCDFYGGSCKRRGKNELRSYPC